MIEKEEMVENMLISAESTSEAPAGVVTVAPSHGSCIKFNQSDPFQIGDKYGGIPLNLLTNLIGWIVLLVLFIFIFALLGMQVHHLPFIGQFSLFEILSCLVGNLVPRPLEPPLMTSSRLASPSSRWRSFKI